MTAAPLRDALIAMLEDAITEREPKRDGCCKDGPACGDHAADRDRAYAMASLLAVIRDAADDEDALAVLATAPLDLLAGITGATTDEDVIAAIGGTGEAS
jgi:hypothetical protein